MSIENPTLSAAADLAHFSSLFTNLRSTFVESALQINSFMQNKAKVKYAKISLSSFMTSKYEKLDNWLFRQTKPKQTQFKPNLSKGQKLMQSVYLQRIMNKNVDRCYEKTKPKQSQFRLPFQYLPA